MTGFASFPHGNTNPYAGKSVSPERKTSFFYRKVTSHERYSKHHKVNTCYHERGTNYHDREVSNPDG